MPEFHAEPYVYIAGLSHKSASGAGSKIRRRTPDDFDGAHTVSWSGECHFLLCTIDGDTMTVRAIGESPERELVDIPRRTPSGDLVQGPIVIYRVGSSGA